MVSFSTFFETISTIGHSFRDTPLTFIPDRFHCVVLLPQTTTAHGSILFRGMGILFSLYAINLFNSERRIEIPRASALLTSSQLSNHDTSTGLSNLSAIAVTTFQLCLAGSFRATGISSERHFGRSQIISCLSSPFCSGPSLSSIQLPVLGQHLLVGDQTHSR